MTRIHNLLAAWHVVLCPRYLVVRLLWKIRSMNLENVLFFFFLAPCVSLDLTLAYTMLQPQITFLALTVPCSVCENVNYEGLKLDLLS